MEAGTKSTALAFAKLPAFTCKTAIILGMKECDIYLPVESIKELLNRLLRIEGQVKGLQRMLKERKSCDDILIQISAVKSALNSVAIKLLKDHAEYCVKPGIEYGDIRAFEDFMGALEKLIKGGC